MYGKLFSSMYEGSLTSRGCWEALVTFQQMIVLANKHGEVDMTAEALSRRTTIPLDIILKGIETLEQPDPYSRTSGEEGRRIVRLDEHRPWGWRIVNYTKYRQIQSSEDRREYFRLQKQKQRAAKAGMSTHVHNVHTASTLSTDVTEAEAVSSKQKTMDGFETFWTAYPRKEAKPAAVKAWKKLKNVDLATILRALDRAKRSDQWQKRGVIPHAATWLNGERWDDELPITMFPKGDTASMIPVLEADQ